MKFPGELKFPDLDHPGVPVVFHVEGSHAELTLEGESLGRWSLYDVRADRLVASAFQVDLAGTEITFVADDPIDFAYRGVEYMAQTWATMKGKKLGARGIVVNRSRKDTKPSRIAEVRAAMESNLENFEPRGLAGEISVQAPPAPASSPVESPDQRVDWDRRDQAAEIPSIGAVPASAQPEPDAEPSAPPAAAEAAGPDILTENQRLEEERRRLEEERAELARQRAEAEQREANLFEAYRLEMKRLEEEREELRRLAAGDVGAAPGIGSSGAPRPGMEVEAADFAESDQTGAVEPEPAMPEPEELEPVEAQAVEPEPAPPEPAELEPVETEAVEPEPALSASGSAGSEPVVPSRSVLDLIEYEAGEPKGTDEAGEERPELEPASDGRVDEEPVDEEPVDEEPVADEPPSDEPPSDEPPLPAPAPAPSPQPEPALAGASRERGGLMGAVKAAFRSGTKDHEHQFIEAPGGIGITRYVCEECGYVSISVAS